MSLKTVFMILQMVNYLVPVAESLFGGHEKAGKQKKAAVKTAVKGIMKGVEEVSTGGQKRTWKEINSHKEVDDFLDGAIDIVADNLFG